MITVRKLLFMSCMSLLALVAGCPGKDEPSATTASTPAAATPETGPPADTAEVPPAPACATSNATGDKHDASIRITLNSDGSVNKIEGKNANGIWEDPRREQSEQPESMGACIASIEVHALNDSTKELMNADGTAAHADAGIADPPYNTHCHRWVVINGVNRLVHCS